MNTHTTEEALLRRHVVQTGDLTVMHPIRVSNLEGQPALRFSDASGARTEFKLPDLALVGPLVAAAHQDLPAVFTALRVLATTHDLHRGRRKAAALLAALSE